MSLAYLPRAQKLTLPSREEMLQRTSSVQQFWTKNKDLLKAAWIEWEAANIDKLSVPNSSLLDADLNAAVTQAWQDPSTEISVKDLLTEVSDGVYQFQLFNPERLASFREYLEAISSAGIPMRPPYGIALNRFGAMLDNRSEGFLAAPGFQEFYREILNKYMRPIGRLMFPEVYGYDSQTFGFSIQYEAGVDTSLRLHTDASAVTLNANINLPDEDFGGSEVDFHDHTTGKVNRLSFKPGMAMIHRGSVAHAAQPITAGSRTNLVFWLYGSHGQVPRYNTGDNQIDAQQRWSPSKAEYDSFAPF